MYVTVVCESVSGWVGGLVSGWEMFSHFRDIYRIYRTCELLFYNCIWKHSKLFFARQFPPGAAFVGGFGLRREITIQLYCHIFLGGFALRRESLGGGNPPPVAQPQFQTRADAKLQRPNSRSNLMKHLCSYLELTGWRLVMLVNSSRWNGRMVRSGFGGLMRARGRFIHEKSGGYWGYIPANFLDFPPNFRLRTRF